MKLFEWRCTLPDRYPDGANSRHMNGHYVWAQSPEEAKARLRAQYPNETIFVEAKPWKDLSGREWCVNEYLSCITQEEILNP